MSEIHEGLSMADYLALPAASASMIRTLIDECPRAAWAESWLNPFRVIDATEATDRGTIAHALLLEGDDSALVAIDPRDHPAEKTLAIPEGWTNKSIRAARDAARAEGKIPVLLADAVAIHDMVGVAREFIESLKESEPAIWQAFQPGGGQSEVTLVWRDGRTLCKMRPDRVNSEWTVIVDYKTTKTSVEPSSWARAQLVGMGYYLSAAWYRRGADRSFETLPDYVFLVQSVESPYLCSLVGCPPAMMEGAAGMIDAGLLTWEECVQADKWPGYPNRVCYPDVPAWLMAKWEEQAVQEIERNGMQGNKAKPSQWLTPEEIEKGAI